MPIHMGEPESTQNLLF